MPVFIFLGWIVGIVLGVIALLLPLMALGFAVPAFLTTLSTVLAPVVALLSPWLAVVIAALFLIVSFIAAYLIATASVAPLLPGLTGVPTLAFPLPTPIATPGAVAVTVPATSGEFFARGMLIGLSVATNALLLGLVPFIGPVLAAWAFIVISLGAIVFVARNRIYQGFLGWSAWLFPLSYLATGVGFLLFLANIPFAFAAFGLGAFQIDWTTGVIETAGGLSGVTGFIGGFSLGNFNFVTALPTPGDFVVASLSSHETGHTLNTAAFGGIVLWINAIDENIAPRRMNLAYGELTAEGHANNFGAPRNDYSLRLWF